MSTEQRRPAGFFKVFNAWHEEIYQQFKRKPTVAEVTSWYKVHAHEVFPDPNDRPTLEDIVKHSRGIRPVEKAKAYQAEYHRRMKEIKTGQDIKSKKSKTPDSCEEQGEHESAAAAPLQQEPKRPAKHRSAAGGQSHTSATSHEHDDSGAAGTVKLEEDDEGPVGEHTPADIQASLTHRTSSTGSGGGKSTMQFMKAALGSMAPQLLHDVIHMWSSRKQKGKKGAHRVSGDSDSVITRTAGNQRVSDASASGGLAGQQQPHDAAVSAPLGAGVGVSTSHHASHVDNSVNERRWRGKEGSNHSAHSMPLPTPHHNASQPHNAQTLQGASPPHHESLYASLTIDTGSGAAAGFDAACAAEAAGGGVVDMMGRDAQMNDPALRDLSFMHMTLNSPAGAPPAGRSLMPNVGSEQQQPAALGLGLPPPNDMFAPDMIIGPLGEDDTSDAIEFSLQGGINNSGPSANMLGPAISSGGGSAAIGPGAFFGAGGGWSPPLHQTAMGGVGVVAAPSYPQGLHGTSARCSRSNSMDPHTAWARHAQSASQQVQVSQHAQQLLGASAAGLRPHGASSHNLLRTEPASAAAVLAPGMGALGLQSIGSSEGHLFNDNASCYSAYSGYNSLSNVSGQTGGTGGGGGPGAYDSVLAFLASTNMAGPSSGALTGSAGPGSVGPGVYNTGTDDRSNSGQLGQLQLGAAGGGASSMAGRSADLRTSINRKPARVSDIYKAVARRRSWHDGLGLAGGSVGGGGGGGGGGGASAAGLDYAEILQMYSVSTSSHKHLNVGSGITKRTAHHASMSGNVVFAGGLGAGSRSSSGVPRTTSLSPTPAALSPARMPFGGPLTTSAALGASGSGGGPFAGGAILNSSSQSQLAGGAGMGAFRAHMAGLSDGAAQQLQPQGTQSMPLIKISHVSASQASHEQYWPGREATLHPYLGLGGDGAYTNGTEARANEGGSGGGAAGADVMMDVDFTGPHGAGTGSSYLADAAAAAEGGGAAAAGGASCGSADMGAAMDVEAPASPPSAMQMQVPTQNDGGEQQLGPIRPAGAGASAVSAPSAGVPGAGAAGVMSAVALLALDPFAAPSSGALPDLSGQLRNRRTSTLAAGSGGGGGGGDTTNDTAWRSCRDALEADILSQVQADLANAHIFGPSSSSAPLPLLGASAATRAGAAGMGPFAMPMIGEGSSFTAAGGLGGGVISAGGPGQAPLVVMGSSNIGDGDGYPSAGTPDSLGGAEMQQLQQQRQWAHSVRHDPEYAWLEEADLNF